MKTLFTKKPLPNVKGYTYSAEILTADEAGTKESDWDEQIYFEVFDAKNTKVGVAGFVYESTGDYVWPSDDYDLAIDIEPEHQKRGIGLALFKEAERLTKREMISSPNMHESTPGGMSLWEKFKRITVKSNSTTYLVRTAEDDETFRRASHDEASLVKLAKESGLASETQKDGLVVSGDEDDIKKFYIRLNALRWPGTFKRIYEGNDLDALEDLKVIVESLQGDWHQSGEDLAKWVKDYPKEAKTLDKGMSSKSLYRAIGISLKNLKTLLNGSLPPLESKRAESWTTKLAVAKTFITYQNCPGNIGVIFKKDIPEEGRMIYTNARKEYEVLCFPQTLTKQDLFKLYIVSNSSGNYDVKWNEIEEITTRDIKIIEKRIDVIKQENKQAMEDLHCHGSFQKKVAGSMEVKAAELKQIVIKQMEDIVAKMEAGEHVPVGDDDYDILVDYLDSIDHPDFNKLASIWVDNKHHLLAFFKNRAPSRQSLNQTQVSADAKKVLDDIAKAVKDFANQFGDLGLDKILEGVRATLQKEVCKNGVPELKDLCKTPVKADLHKSTVIPGKEWNERAFKLNYKKWLDGFVSKLKDLKKQLPDFDAKAVLEPLLKVDWKDVKVTGSFRSKIEGKYRARAKATKPVICKV